MVTTTCDYLQSFGSYPRAMRPANAADIDSWLSNLINSRHFRRTPLCVRSVLNAGLGSELLNKLRLFQGASLSLLAAPGERTDELIAEIVRTLPPEVCLNLEFIDPPYTVGPANFEEKITEIAERISHIPQVGRPTSFKLDQLEDLCESPEAISVLLDVVCGKEMVSFFHFGRVRDADAMLLALCDRARQFRHLKLVAFECCNMPTRARIEALAEALKQRHGVDQSRLTVVIGDTPDFDLSDITAFKQISDTLTSDELFRMESAGLYFGAISSLSIWAAFCERVLGSIGKGPIDVLLPRPRPVPRVPSSGSDVKIGPSEDEVSLNLPSDDGEVRLDLSRAVPQGADAQRVQAPSEPQLQTRRLGEKN